MEAMNTPLFYIALFVHLVSLITGFGAVIVIDMFGLLWMGRRVSMMLVNQVADITQRLVWLGWGGLVVSGTVLITLKGYVDNLTMIKLFFVAMLGVNGYLLHRIKHSMRGHAENQPMSRELMFRIGFSSFLSQLGWWGALTIGFLHRHWQHTINWPPHPFIIMMLLCGVLMVVGALGVSLSKKSLQKNANARVNTEASTRA